jgi:hypothetical protein
MWGTSSPEDKLTGDLGNVIEATQIGGRRVGSSYGVKIITGQFWTFATISAPSSGRLGSALRPVLEVLRTYREPIERVKYATAEDYMSAIQIALGAAIGAVIGVVMAM